MDLTYTSEWRPETAEASLLQIGHYEAFAWDSGGFAVHIPGATVSRGRADEHSRAAAQAAAETAIREHAKTSSRGPIHG